MSTRSRASGRRRTCSWMTIDGIQKISMHLGEGLQLDELLEQTLDMIEAGRRARRGQGTRGCQDAGQGGVPRATFSIQLQLGAGRRAAGETWGQAGVMMPAIVRRRTCVCDRVRPDRSRWASRCVSGRPHRTSGAGSFGHRPCREGRFALGERPGSKPPGCQDMLRCDAHPRSSRCCRSAASRRARPRATAADTVQSPRPPSTLLPSRIAVGCCPSTSPSILFRYAPPASSPPSRQSRPSREASSAAPTSAVDAITSRSGCSTAPRSCGGARDHDVPGARGTGDRFNCVGLGSNSRGRPEIASEPAASSKVCDGRCEKAPRPAPSPSAPAWLGMAAGVARRQDPPTVRGNEVQG